MTLSHFYIKLIFLAQEPAPGGSFNTAIPLEDDEASMCLTFNHRIVSLGDDLWTEHQEIRRQDAQIARTSEGSSLRSVGSGRINPSELI